MFKYIEQNQEIAANERRNDLGYVGGFSIQQLRGYTGVLIQKKNLPVFFYYTEPANFETYRFKRFPFQKLR